MGKNSKFTHTFAEGDRVIMLSTDRELGEFYPASVLGKVGVVLCTYGDTAKVDFGDNLIRFPWVKNLRPAKEYYIAKFKELYGR